MRSAITRSLPPSCRTRLWPTASDPIAGTIGTPARFLHFRSEVRSRSVRPDPSAAGCVEQGW
jgi:hypothetical protein